MIWLQPQDESGKNIGEARSYGDTEESRAMIDAGEWLNAEGTSCASVVEFQGETLETAEVFAVLTKREA